MEGEIRRQPSADQAEREQALTDEVVASFAQTPDARLRMIMQSLVRHLHSFLRETGLTEQEWRSGIDFLTAAGHMTDERRQEFVLLSDVLGASMQTITINNEAYADATEATVLGPFFVEGAPEIDQGGDIAFGAPGQPCWVQGTVRDTAGAPLPGALLEIWECDEDGFYDVQYAGEALQRGDAVFGVKQSLVREFAVQPAGTPTPDGRDLGGREWARVEFDIVLAPEGS